ncbi:MAG: DUF507 family protein [Polyangiaceae bacterium]|nr:DUF507 family protein [Polyangiaceae bacterium]
MRLFSAKVPGIASEMVELLTTDGAIECEDRSEVVRDVEAVLQQYVRDEQEVSDKARDLLAARGLPHTDLGKMRRLVADQRKLKIGDDAIDYLLDQLVEMLMHSTNVAEVFVEDWELRKRMRDPLRKQASEEESLQEEVRGRLKHVEEGSALWEIEYRRMMEDIKRRKGL